MKISLNWLKEYIEINETVDEVSEVLEKSFRWGRAWLDEFYDDPEKSGEHYILWTDQCLKEFQTMKTVVEQHD